MDNILKRKKEEEPEEDDVIVGPVLPDEQTEPKKKKVLPYETLYLDNLPSAESYEKSYMHRDVVTHVVASKTDFIITGSYDGHVKFWKKQEEGIEFVKHFRSHMGPVTALSVSPDGSLLLSVSSDKSLKVFDVMNFDMINMVRLNFEPGVACWIHNAGDTIQAMAVAEAVPYGDPAPNSKGRIWILDGRGDGQPLHCLDSFHPSYVTAIAYNAPLDSIVSADRQGIIECWRGPANDYKSCFESKLDTDLFVLAKDRTYATSIAFSPDGTLMAMLAGDHRVRLFKFTTGKLRRIWDESPKSAANATPAAASAMEFNRRLATEREIDKSDANALANLVFDISGHFLLYGTMHGIKILNTKTSRCTRLLGRTENMRTLQIALIQSRVGGSRRAALTVELEASDNPTLAASAATDPTVICTAYKKNRFYIFSRREPAEDDDRDVFNERPSKEDQIAATDASEATIEVVAATSAIIHTTIGDIVVQLFANEVPRTVENFTRLSRRGYYNGHIFHRIIKGFMAQTGDPTGTGTGGESCWGGEFPDEFHPKLRHDRPYTLSMANAGPDSNGSQFFITVIPTPWLDNKHTVFGRVTRGMETVQNLSQVKTNPKTDKPYEDIKILSVTVK